LKQFKIKQAVCHYSIFNKAVDSYQQIFLTFDMDKSICDKMFPFFSLGLASFEIKKQLLDSNQLHLNNIQFLEIMECSSLTSLKGLGVNITRLSLKAYKEGKYEWLKGRIHFGIRV
jgi:hypothetical protein